MFNRIKYFDRIIKQYGWQAVFFLLLSKFKKNKLENIYIKGINGPISLSNYGPDVSTLFKIFYARDYDMQLNQSPNFIIDCGANIGLSAVFFAAKYPNALIIAIEPDKGNFEFLQKNTLSFNNVVCMNSAVWSSNIAMKVVDEGKGNWAIQTVIADNNEEGSVPGISLDQILENFRQETIDLLKIDIEGAEKELFSANYRHWLAKTKVIAIELHDLQEDNIRKTFYKALEGFQYEEYRKGENIICEFI